MRMNRGQRHRDNNLTNRNIATFKDRLSIDSLSLIVNISKRAIDYQCQKDSSIDKIMVNTLEKSV